MADDDLDVLAWTMLGEAAGEGTQGMADVGHVILNRLNTGRYGASIQDVALSPKQFSAWNSGAGGNDPKGRFPKGSDEFKRARQLAEQVVAGTIAGPPGRPLDYHAPSVNPFWADSKDRNGTYTRNGHVFYPSVPVPPGEVPNMVGSLTDTIPASAPMPVTPTPDMAMMRRAAAPSTLIADSFGRLPQPPTNTRTNAADLLAMERGQTTPFLTRDGQGVIDPAQIALYGKNPDYQAIGSMPQLPAAVRSVPPMPTRTAQTYAGQDGAPRSIPNAPIPAMPSPQTAMRRAVDPTLQAALNAKYPAQLPPLPASVPTKQLSASDMARGNSGISTIASIPTTGVGQPPATRTVQSVPMKPAQVQPPIQTEAQRLAALYANGGPTRPEPAMPTTAQVQGGTGFHLPPAIPNRLPTGQPGMPLGYADAGGYGVAGVGTKALAPIPAAPIQRAPQIQTAGAKIPPIPMPANMRPFGVGTQLDVKSLPPMPRARPEMGTGGPNLNNPSVIGVAPVPMPRLQRPGIFGKPQIGGVDVPLPGILGAIQNFTGAMNNASGPFNNGADNLLYNIMRGGNFDAQGAATHQSPSGYSFAPDGNGGFINVGRTNRNLTPAQTYAVANAGGFRNGGDGTVPTKTGKKTFNADTNFWE